jgi:Methyltransferase domain
MLDMDLTEPVAGGAAGHCDGCLSNPNEMFNTLPSISTLKAVGLESRRPEHRDHHRDSLWHRVQAAAEPNQDEQIMFDTLKRHPGLVLRQVIADPLDTWAALQDTLADRLAGGRTLATYHAVANWEEQYTQLLDQTREGAQFRAPNAEFNALWPKVIGSLRDRGMAVGPFSFHEWNDGDAGFVRAIWSYVRNVKPDVVVETGVAHGMTSRFVLEALERNRNGRLWSIDKPPFNPQTRKEVGCAIDDEGLRQRWTYIAGTSRRRLRPLLQALRQVDLFIHDSLHSTRNVLFELETAWSYLKPGGVMVIDDIDVNNGFSTFTEAHPTYPALVCEAEPISPDARRFNQKGLFGIVVKTSASEG